MIADITGAILDSPETDNEKRALKEKMPRNMHLEETTRECQLLRKGKALCTTMRVCTERVCLL